MNERHWRPDPTELTEGLDEELTPADSALWGRLAAYLVDPGTAGTCLSEETVRALEAACPPVALDPALSGRLTALARQAETNLEFERGIAAGGRDRSLGAYLTFLRQRSGLTLRTLGQSLNAELQLLTDLERDRLGPQGVPARLLARLLRRLEGSLELAEELVAAAVRAPRRLTADPRGSLFRGAPGATPEESEAASAAARGDTGGKVNPEWVREREAAVSLIEALRREWREDGSG